MRDVRVSDDNEIRTSERDEFLGLAALGITAFCTPYVAMYGRSLISLRRQSLSSQGWTSRRCMTNDHLRSVFDTARMMLTSH